MKTCARCKDVKPSDAFYPDKSKKDKLSSYCKECRRKHAQTWAQQHPDARRRIMSDWKVRTDIQAHNRKTWVKRCYGKNPEEIDALFHQQNGKCAICKEGLTAKYPTYHIDHDHRTGEVRGLLCRNCNVGLGFFQDSVERLIAGVGYLSQTA